ncbi:hypothetical protein DPMN_051291 [Dreissena polymorpha]|uniref:SRCR domain-containing protein n=1 Tax=Dreissena polymorpha TaxID=45954 RepID=A0A9D4CIA2_DREPO|nr:hypothetical protein DPMN_051291 [Dreissena polymorpha]
METILIQLVLSCIPGFAATSTVPPVTVRLAGGGNSWGRVEVLHDGVWGTVCEDNADIHFANVLCKELGMSNGTKLHVGDYTEGSGKIWLDDVTCTGTESSIVNCKHSGWGYNNCGHLQDVGVLCGDAECGMPPTIDNGHIVASGQTVYNSNAEVICRPGYSAFQIASKGVIRCLPSGWQNVSCEPISNVRLQGDGSFYRGRVEVYQNRLWGTVCVAKDKRDVRIANVICNQLGMQGGRYLEDEEFSKGTGPVQLSNVVCTGFEASVINCTHSGLGVQDCGHDDDIGVMCNKSAQVRLKGGQSQFSGRVEVYYYGVWGTVCDDGTDMHFVTVVCNELGLHGGKLLQKGEYETGTSNILLDEVRCNGSESSIVNCKHDG